MSRLGPNHRSPFRAVVMTIIGFTVAFALFYFCSLAVILR